MSKSGSPIQRRVSPFEYVCVAGKTIATALSGTLALIPNSSNSPAAIVPPSQVTVPMRSACSRAIVA